jgi:intein-encoded DNA endonuclease-like protein
MAGYVDAEGSFGLNQLKARFKIDSYDVEILGWMRGVLQKSSLHIIFRQIAKKGQPQYRIGIFHKDLWRFEINEARSIFRFIHMVSPYMRHEKRKADMIRCQHNIEERLYKRTIV